VDRRAQLVHASVARAWSHPGIPAMPPRQEGPVGCMGAYSVHCEVRGLDRQFSIHHPGSARKMAAASNRSWPAATSSVPKCQSGSRRLVGPTGPDCRCEIGDSRVRGHAKGPGPRPAPFRSNAQCSLPRTWSCAKPLAARQDPNRSRNSRHTTVRPYSHEGPFEGTIEDLCSAPF
jgi:hypothetical protein